MSSSPSISTRDAAATEAITKVPTKKTTPITAMRATSGERLMHPSGRRKLSRVVRAPGRLKVAVLGSSYVSTRPSRAL